MSDTKIKEENLDEIVENVVKDIKKGKQLSENEIEKLMLEANENVEFVKVLDDIKLASPDNRVIFVDGNEQLIYDHGEFFICETTDSRTPRKKLKRKEATERYIEYFIRYQLNPIIEQKNLQKEVKNITKNEVLKSSNIETKDNKVKSKKVEIKKEEEVKTSTEKIKSTPKKDKIDLER